MSKLYQVLESSLRDGVKDGARIQRSKARLLIERECRNDHDDLRDSLVIRPPLYCICGANSTGHVSHLA